MRRLLSDRVERPAVAGRGWLPGAAALFALGMAVPATAQQDSAAATDTPTAVVEATDSVVSAGVSIGRDEAMLQLGLSNGRTVEFMLDNGTVRVDGESIGTYDEGGGFDRAWRGLLEEASMASTVELPVILREWEPPATGQAVARELDERLEQALLGVGGRMLPRKEVASSEDSIDRLLARIDELEADMDERVVYVRDRRFEHTFLHDVADGFATFFASLIWLGVLFGLGAGLLFFGDGRLERVSQTVRDEPLRSGLIGLAGAFLAIPFYVLVIIALAISIIGIPLIIAWAPLFPLLVSIAGIVGWLAVAYGAGDALVTGRLATRPRFQDAGPFKRLLVGSALLLSPFFVGGMVSMLSVLDWAGELLIAIGVMTTMLAAAIGFGAVLVRGRDAMDRQRERRAAARRARLEQQQVVTPAGGETND